MKALALLAAATLLQDDAAREAQAADLETFTGGWHGVVITAFVPCAPVRLFLEVIEPHHAHVHPHPHPHGPIHP